MSVADQGSPAPSLRRLPFTVRLAPQLINQLIKKCDHPAAADQINGILFGLIEEGVVTVQAHRSFEDRAQAGGSQSRGSQDKLFEQHLSASQKDPETRLLKLIGWYAVRLEGGLTASDLTYHDWYFPRSHDLALILKPEPPLGVALELYCRTLSGQLNEEGHRVGLVRLSNSPVEAAVEVVPQPRIRDDFFMRAYDLMESDEEAPPGWKGTLAFRYRKAFSFLRRGNGEAALKPIPPTSTGRDPIRELAREHVAEKPKLPVPAPNVPVLQPASSDVVKTAPQTPLQTAAPALPLSPLAQAPVLLHQTPTVPALSNLPVSPAKAVRQRRPWVPALLAFAITSLLTFGLIYYLQISGRLPEFLQVLAPHSGLGLKVEAQSDRLLVSWNRQNSLVRNARSGSLLIEDGGQKRQVSLDASHVRDGSVLYHPISTDLTFRLEVRGTDGQGAVESIQLLEASKPEALDLPKSPSIPPVSANQNALAPKPSPSKPLRESSKTLPEPVEAATENTPLATTAPEFKPPANVSAEAPKANAEKVNDDKVPVIPEEPAPGQVTFPEQLFAKPPEPFRQAAPTQIEASRRANPAPAAANAAAYEPPRPTRQVLPNISSLPPGVLMQAGQLEVVVRVDETGRVIKAEAAEGKRVNQVLVESAIAAARQWKFEPATLRGKAVPSQHSIIFQFSGRH